jgi:hypothetical protein
MPFKSSAQRKYLNANPEVLGKTALAEWNSASKGQHVPEHVKNGKPSYSHARKARKELEK